MSTAAGAASSSDVGGGVRLFSGDSEDAREYKRWKVWALNKLLTLGDKVPSTARGAYIYTLLTGKALECVEHIDPTQYQKAGGEKVLLDALDRRFPQKDESDELSETLTEIFSLRSQEGESLKTWISRATEAFDKCLRKTSVSFPEEAKGWIILHKSGLSEEQKAVCLARSLGVLKREEIGRAMRSCYPEYVVPKKKSYGVSLVEDEIDLPFSLEGEIPDEDGSFLDVEQFLADYEKPTDDEVYSESEVAEALAVSWREKRKELNRLQRARKFDQAGSVRRAFKVEVEELKKRTRCHRCNQTGHWSRECKMPKGQGKGKTGSSGKESGAALVEHFVASVESSLSVLDRLRAKRAQAKSEVPPHEALLVSSPGYGVLDSGCGRSIIGQNTLIEFEKMWAKLGIPPPERISETNFFRYGNGEQETSTSVVMIPVTLGSRTGVIRTAVVKGQAPLLISRVALKTLQGVLDFARQELRVFEEQEVIPLQTNAAGQLIVYVLPTAKSDQGSFDEIMLSEMSKSAIDTHQVVPSDVTLEPQSQSQTSSAMSEPLDTHVESKNSPSSGPELQCWSREDSFLRTVPTSGKQGPYWHLVRRRVVSDMETNEVLFDERIDHVKGKSFYHHEIPQDVMQVRTEFFFEPQEKIQPLEQLSVRQVRQLKAQIRDQVSSPEINGKHLMVAEVFSPPRFTPVVESFGFSGKSFDLVNGYDFTKPEVRSAVKQELKECPPALLILCPPCTDEGGWSNLNMSHMSPSEVLRRRRRSRLFIRFCAELFEQQVQLGGRALVEHPHGSRLWTYHEIVSLIGKHHLLKCHMCRFNLKLPDDDKLIRKPTRLLVSHEDMKSLEKVCPGVSDPKHKCHQVIAGSWPGTGSISTFAGRYTPDFVQAVLETVPTFARAFNAALVEVEPWPEKVVDEVLMAKGDLACDDEEKVMKAIDKLHRNLGHPPVHDMVRVLKHAQASELALTMARKHECDFCKSQVRPHVPLPSKSSRPTSFNEVIGIDVKHLVGWKPNQKVKALNIVCQASCYQLMLPFYETETSGLLQRLFQEYWMRVFGPPREILLDQAATNMGEPLQQCLDMHGTTVRPIAGEAHWQLGRTENHGGWFGRILARLCDEYSPSNKADWEQCVLHAHVKNQMIQSYGFTPHQYVFGKNPDVPGDLLSEPLSVVPATAGLTDEQVARSQEIRTSARRAVADLQSDQAIRRALAARPRKVLVFTPGDLVAYWRNQKFQQGTLIQGGRWHGTAVIIGSIGRNYVVAHRKQIFRVAPEQLRFATTEERTVINSPQAELLGVKDLLEGGTFKGHQYIDLVPGEYPPGSVGGSTPPEPVSVQNESPAAPDASPTKADEENQIERSNPTAALEPSPDVESHESHEYNREKSSTSSSSSGDTSVPSSYGPVRRRVGQKSGDAALYRPPAMLQEDFIEMMREVVPRLVDTAMNEGESSSGGPKREREHECHEEPPNARQRTSDATDEILSVQDVSELLQVWDEGQSIETLVASYIQKKTSKELPPTGNPPELQKLVDESKVTEWGTLTEKTALKIHYGQKAARLKEQFPDRFMGSRFVIIRKPSEENMAINPNDPSTFKVKSRWCLQGHLDPDLQCKAEEGLLQSPTLSQIGRMLLMQIISSFQWDLQLGDIKGAFLEAGPLPEKYRPLFASQPKGGIPGVPTDAVLEIVGNVYGQNDAPCAWYKTFDSEVTSIGWEKSKLDPCLYFLRCPRTQKLQGIMGVHVDDTALGGQGPWFEQAVAKLKKRFPYRKWRVSEGEFCGAYYTQDVKTKSIEMSQKTFVESLKSAYIPKGALNQDGLSDGQIRVLRAINGSLNWVSSQSRPDLAAQTSFSQQAFPKPTIRNLRDANNAIRRAKMHKDLVIKFHPISPENLSICCHSDAAWANVGEHTQAGFILAFVDKKLNHGAVSEWTPVVWKSYKMSRAVSSTLAGESQALATATGTVEWLSLLMCEALDGAFDPRQARSLLSARPPIITTDCKSLYDHLVSPSSPTAIEDRRTSIDIVIIRESLKNCSGVIRWLPTDRMIADGLTKDKIDPIELLRSRIRVGKYQISAEETVLANQAAEKELRAKRRQLQESTVPVNAIPPDDISGMPARS